MCSLSCDYCWYCFGSPPKSFALVENFLTALGKPMKQMGNTHRVGCVSPSLLSNPRWLSAQHLGCPLSAWSPPLQVPWAWGLAVAPQYGPMQGKIAPAEAPGTSLCLETSQSQLPNTAAPRAELLRWSRRHSRPFSQSTKFGSYVLHTQRT